MASFDAAERELDAAFGRFEGLVARLREWRAIEAAADRRVETAEGEALRLVEEALAEAETARAAAAAAAAERDELTAERDRLAGERDAERQRLTAELAATRGRLDKLVADTDQQAAAAERQGRQLRETVDSLQQQLRTALAEKARIEQQAAQLAGGRQALERETLLLKGEVERLGRELHAVRTRGDKLEQASRAAAAQLAQALGQGG
jgi:colicin import membrane protein